jgi:hypothetical protein
LSDGEQRRRQPRKQGKNSGGAQRGELIRSEQSEAAQDPVERAAGNQREAGIGFNACGFHQRFSPFRSNTGTASVSAFAAPVVLEKLCEAVSPGTAIQAVMGINSTLNPIRRRKVGAGGTANQAGKNCTSVPA